MENIRLVNCQQHQARVLHLEKDAPTCVYLFGALQDISTISMFTDELSKHYNYLAIELPGTGRTDPLSPTYSFAYLAECLNDVLLETVGDIPVRIVACSYGAASAGEWAKRYPDRVTQIAFAGAMAHIPEKHWPTLFNLMHLAYGEKKEFSAGFIDLMMDRNINLDRFNSIKKAAIRKARYYSDEHVNSFIYNTIRLCSHEVGDLSGVTAPVLVTTGEYDPFCEVPEAIALAEKFVNGRFIPLIGCDHLFHIEDPNQLIDTVMRFFSRYKPVVNVTENVFSPVSLAV